MAAFKLDKQVDACWEQYRRLQELDRRGDILVPAETKPRSQRGKARCKSEGKRRGDKPKPSHVTAPRLLRREVAKARIRAEQAWGRVLLTDLSEELCPFFWEGGRPPISGHPSYGGRWWLDCARQAANVTPEVARAMLAAVSNSPRYLELRELCW